MVAIDGFPSLVSIGTYLFLKVRAAVALFRALRLLTVTTGSRGSGAGEFCEPEECGKLLVVGGCASLGLLMFAHTYLRSRAS